MCDLSQACVGQGTVPAAVIERPGVQWLNLVPSEFLSQVTVWRELGRGARGSSASPTPRFPLRIQAGCLSCHRHCGMSASARGKALMASRLFFFLIKYFIYF